MDITPNALRLVIRGKTEIIHFARTAIGTAFTKSTSTLPISVCGSSNTDTAGSNSNIRISDDGSKVYTICLTGG